MSNFDLKKHFARPQLAKHMAESLLGRVPFSDAPNGLFLAAPRRTGKSAFLQQDLRPALQSEGVVVVYLDLWVNRDKDPSTVIAQAIGSELLKHLGTISKAPICMGLESVTVAGVLKMDTKKIGQPDGLTLNDALTILIEKSKKPVAVIIDEAQHSLTRKSGETAMMALKSARDTINNSGGKSLMLVMSGSDRDKLMRLVNTTSSAFYGSLIQKMPLLDKSYTDDVSNTIERVSPNLTPIDRDKMHEAFILFGSRPQFFSTAIGKAFNPLEFIGQRVEDTVMQLAKEQVSTNESQMMSDYLGLKDIEQLVVWRMLETGSKFRPYDSDALRFYLEKGGKSVTPQQIQAALNSLRSRDPSIIWKSERGDYALDDTQMRDWYLELVKNNSWPPNTVEPDDADYDLPRIDFDIPRA